MKLSATQLASYLRSPSRPAILRTDKLGRCLHRHWFIVGAKATKRVQVEGGLWAGLADAPNGDLVLVYVDEDSSD